MRHAGQVLPKAVGRDEVLRTAAAQRELAFQARQENPEVRAAHRRRWIQINKANKAAKKRRGSSD